MSIYITTNEKNDGQTARPPTARLCGTAEHSGVAKEKAREGRKVRSPPATGREKRSRAVALAAQPAVAENRESWLQKTASRFKTNSPADRAAAKARAVRGARGAAGDGGGGAAGAGAGPVQA